MGKYFDAIKAGNEAFHSLYPNTMFIGQAVEYEGTALSNTIKDIPFESRLELPVFENTQMGITLGMAMNRIPVVSIFPRLNFLICACDQLVNHLDKYVAMTQDDDIHVVIRTAIGSDIPMYPGHQHIGDLSYGIEAMLKGGVKVIHAYNSFAVTQAYEDVKKKGIYLIVEDGNSYAH